MTAQQLERAIELTAKITNKKEKIELLKNSQRIHIGQTYQGGSSFVQNLTLEIIIPKEPTSDGELACVNFINLLLLCLRKDLDQLEKEFNEL